MPKFPGWSSPTYTPVPDALFDEVMHDLSGAELKVLLYIIRRTFGFKKESDNISLAQLCNGIKTKDGRVLDHGTGLNKTTVAAAVKRLEEDGYIIRERNASVEKGDEPTTYRLNLLPVSFFPTPPVGKIQHPPNGSSDTPVSRNSDTQQPSKQHYRRQQKKTSRNGMETEEERLEKLRRSAEQVGFNPEIFGINPEET
jgi:hypothetical protein